MATELFSGAAFGLVFDKLVGGSIDKLFETSIALIRAGYSYKEDAENLKRMVNDLRRGLAQWFYQLGPSKITEYERDYYELCDCMDDALVVTQKALGLTELQVVEKFMEKSNCSTEMESIKRRLQRFREAEFVQALKVAMEAEVARREDLQRDIQDRPDPDLQVQDRPPLSKEIFQHLDELVPRLKGLLRESRVVGIIGMAGIGKTTVVKRVFDDMKRDFTHAYEMVVSSTPDLLKLLKGAWGELFRERAPFEDIEEGRDKFATKLRDKKVLLLLDDVWDPEHLRILNFATSAGKSHDKSRLLVTTRNQEHLREVRDLVPNNPREFQQVEVPFLLDQHAMELLCYTAFDGARAPPPTHAEVAQAMLKECKGLPLALLVVGGGLAGKNVKEWEARLARLATIGFKDLMGICYPSYEELGPEGRVCFKLFAGYPEDARVPEEVLVLTMAGLLPLQEHVAAERMARSCLVDLCSRYLVRVDEDVLGDEGNKYYMHDVLRDLAMNEVQKTMRQLFLLDDEALENVQVHRTTYDNVRHMSLKGSADPAKWPTDCWLPNLRVLDLSETKIGTLPSVFTRSPHLKVLIMYNCDGLKRLPEGISAMTELKALNLNGCTFLVDLPEGISAMTSLEKLDLSNCNRLVCLPHGISVLTCLKKLNLDKCKSLAALPDGISSLTNLKVLDLNHCQRLAELPEKLAALTGLEVLKLSVCKNLAALPEGISALTGLKKLNLNNCRSLAALPKGISNLTGLEVLDLSWCKNLATLPAGIAALTGLKELGLSYCERLAALPEGISTLTGLKELDLRHCKNLAALPEGISKLTGLRELILWRCSETVQRHFNLVALDRQMRILRD